MTIQIKRVKRKLTSDWINIHTYIHTYIHTWQEMLYNAIQMSTFTHRYTVFPLYQVKVLTIERILSDGGDGPERNRRKMESYPKASYHIKE